MNKRYILVGKWPVKKEYQYLYMCKEHRKLFFELVEFHYPTSIADFTDGDCSLYLDFEEREELHALFRNLVSEKNLKELKKMFKMALENSDCIQLTMFENFSIEMEAALQDILYSSIKDNPEKFFLATRAEWESLFRLERFPLKDKALDIKAKYLSFCSTIRELTKTNIREKADYEAIRLEMGDLCNAQVWLSTRNGVIEYKERFFQIDSRNECNSCLQGICSSKGVYKGSARVVKVFDEVKELKNGEVLVAIMTNVTYDPYLSKASAFVIELGGVTSHVSILAREEGKPCIVSARGATSNINTGDIVEVNAEKGVVRKIK